ncbi:hypothetical protein ZWY2020_055197 [Hordeum vulgare]|nr:hypothetical protein ZWY2020_055197 [Hordeum vulgare]
MKAADLLNVSYVIRYSIPGDKNPVRPSDVTNYSNYSYSFEKRKIWAEGIYDRKRGVLCMVGCQEHDGSTDCQTLVTVQFISLDSMEQEHGTGAISSLRDKTDPLFFKKMDYTLHRIGCTPGKPRRLYRGWTCMESIMIVASTTASCVFTILQILHTKRNPDVASTTASCVFTILQILHTKRNPDVAPATSVTMIAVLTMGYLAPLVLNSEALFASRRSEYYEMHSTRRWPEMKEVMMRAPTLIVFLLQLRLLQLAWSGRRRASAMFERTVLWICLPLYALGGVLAAVVHVINARACPLAINMGRWPAMVWQDLVSYAGLILDGFLLPQVILNASLGASRARAISPSFYMGGTVLRLMPHVYDVVRAQINKQPSMRSSLATASSAARAWDAVIACGAALLALLLFLQQRQASTHHVVASFAEEEIGWV